MSGRRNEPLFLLAVVPGISLDQCPRWRCNTVWLIVIALLILVTGPWLYPSVFLLVFLFGLVLALVPQLDDEF